MDRLALLALLALLAAACSDAAADPAIVFGVVADVQYAEKATHETRRYSEALDKLRRAVVEWNREPLKFVLQLGDLVDGNGELTELELEETVEALGRSRAPVRHVVGNHCLEAGRAVYDRVVPPESYHYDFVEGDWRFVVLDGNDISTRDLPTDGPAYRAASAYIEATEENRPWNGAIGPAQLEWLRATLAQARTAGQRVIVACHFPALPEAARRSMVLWNFEEVLDVLESSGCVVAYLAGHDHAGGYAERAGIHHVTFPAMCDAPAGDTAHALVTLRGRRMYVSGFGTVPMRELLLREVAPAD